MVFGMTGVATGPRSILGYEQGALSLAKDLAMITGAPFSPLFNIGNQTPNQVYPGNVYGGVGGSNAYADSFRVQVADPMVNAIQQQTQILYGGLQNVAQSVVNPRAATGVIMPSPTGGGGQVVTYVNGQPVVLSASQASNEMESQNDVYTAGGAGGIQGFVQRNKDMGLAFGGSLASRFLGSRLGIPQNTFGGTLAQSGLDVFIQSALIS